jgi:prophage antirepressor-like protein
MIKGKDNQYSNQTIYLTEFGLYECLFTTNKPIAFEFRLQVM